MQLFFQVSDLIPKAVSFILFHSQLLLYFFTVVIHLLQLVFKLRSTQVLADVALGPRLPRLLQFLLQRHHHLRQILDLALPVRHLLAQLGVVKHLGALNAGLHALHQRVVLALQLLDVALQLLRVLEQVLVLLPRLHGIRRFLQLLHHVVVLRLQPRVLLVHHGDALVLVDVVVSHRTALKLGVVVGKRLIFLKQLVVAVLPHPPRLLLYLVGLDLLVLLDVLLHFLQNLRILVSGLHHVLDQQVIFFLQSHPVLLIVHSQELLSEETCIFGRPLVFPKKSLVLLVKIEESLLPERRLGLLLLVVFRRILLVALLLVVLWRILAVSLLFVVFRRILLILSLLTLLIIPLLIIFCRVLLSLNELRLSLNVLSLKLCILLLLMLRRGVHARCRVLCIQH